MRAPLSAWPVSWAEVLRDVNGQSLDTPRPAHVQAALVRVQRAARQAARLDQFDITARVAGSAEPMTLRRFADVPREQGELEGALQYTGERFAFRLQGAVVADPADGKEFRPDGSYVGAALGNWMLSAGYVDRWWGPGWEGSLILGSNARPMPAISIDRNYSDGFETPWLAWIGQWRLHATLAQFEGDRNDAPDARLFAMRVTWKPHDRLEVGLSRSAQWCGEGRPCGFSTFWDLLTGNDNDQPLDQQPGNQLAGFDFRWSVPWVPVALYGQAIGEDEAGGFPSKYLGLMGLETWGGWGERSWRVHAEYADTACVFNESPPEFGCAYRNSIYSDGYQYRNRSLGHAIDGDSEQIAVGAMLVNPDGSSWEFAAQNSKINRAGANAVHSISPVPLKLRSADVYRRQAFLGGDLEVGLGYEERSGSTPAQDGSDVRGFVDWTWRFE